MRRREINLFNISFLDLLSGALAAVLILFIIVPKMQADDAETLKEFETLEMEVSTIKDKLEELKNSVSKEIFNKLEEQFKEMEEEIEKLEKTISTLKSKVENLENALNECEEEKAQLEEEIEELKKKTEETIADLKSTKEENVALDSEIRQLESRVTNAERALSVTEKLDLIFVLDCSGSMGGVINDIKSNLKGTVRVLQKTVESLRVGFVAYQDRDGKSIYATRSFELKEMNSSGLVQLQSFVDNLSAASGVSWEELVNEGMRDAKNQNWRNDVKEVMIVIGDAISHDNEACFTISRNFASSGQSNKVSSIYCKTSDSSNNDKVFFQSIARYGQGEFVDNKPGRIMESILLSVMD